MTARPPSVSNPLAGQPCRNHGHLPTRLVEVPKGRPVVAYCQVGQRGYPATRILSQAGYTVSNLGDGYTTYLPHLPDPS